jgi:hypothetical protein
MCPPAGTCRRKRARASSMSITNVRAQKAAAWVEYQSWSPSESWEFRGGANSRTSSALRLNRGG